MLEQAEEGHCQSHVCQKHACLGLPICLAGGTRAATGLLHFGGGAPKSLLVLLRIAFEIVQVQVAVCPLTYKLSAAFFEEGNGTPLQYSCLENPMDGGAWQAVVHGVAKGWIRLSNFTFPFHFHALEKEMATHSSVLAQRIRGTGEPGGLPSVGSHRVGHD